jgi:hypothetical protein
VDIARFRTSVIAVLLARRPRGIVDLPMRSSGSISSPGRRLMEGLMPRSAWSRRWTAAVLGLALAAAGTGAEAASPFDDLEGTWSGSGRIRLDDGKTEGLKCKAYYLPKDGGTELGLALRCASASNKIELRANLAASGNRVSGSWEERTFNASGNVTGHASDNRINLSINGGGFNGSMAVTTTGKSQVISVSTNGIALRGVNVNLRRD